MHNGPDDTVNGSLVNLWPRSLVYKSVARVRSIIYPPSCLLCDLPGWDGKNLCLDCHADLPWNRHACRRCALPLAAAQSGGLCGQCLARPPAFEETLAPLRYDASLRWLIAGLKFRQQLGHAGLLGWMLATHLANSAIALPDRLLPVPLHRSRLRARGYNQALEIARPVARQLGVRLDHRSLRRIRATPPQSELNLKARQRNIRGAFRSLRRFDGEHVALLDDVITSGHTVREIAGMLRKAGAERISVWAVARAPAPGAC